jgi:hypothetical protein
MPVVSADLFPAERASLNFAPVHQAIDLTSDTLRPFTDPSN